MSHRSSRSVGFLITLATAVSACGGGSDDEVTGLACGPGTREDAGRCVPDGSGGAGAGGAAGSGGGAGGTTGGASGGAGAPGGGAGMAGASTGGSAGAAGASAGGAAGTSGSAGSSAGASGAGAGGGGASAGTGGAGGSASGAGGAGNGGAAGAGLQDDPCPSELVIDFNASDTCGGTKPADLKVCVDQYAATLAGSDHPFVIRTPSHPGVGTGCKAYCGWGYAWVESLALKPGLTSTKKYFRITGGGKGWQWYFAGFDEMCPTHPPTVGCEATWTTNPEPRLVIFTADPDAPSVNLRVEVSTQPFSCP